MSENGVIQVALSSSLQKLVLCVALEAQVSALEDFKKVIFKPEDFRKV